MFYVVPTHTQKIFNMIWTYILLIEYNLNNYDISYYFTPYVLLPTLDCHFSEFLDFE